MQSGSTAALYGSAAGASFNELVNYLSTDYKMALSAIFIGTTLSQEVVRPNSVAHKEKVGRKSGERLVYITAKPP